MKKAPLYSWITRIWVVVFLVVGLSFLFLPETVSRFLTDLANIIGLQGNIPAPAGTLWHVLSLSLMSAVTLCAYFSGKNPEHKGIFITLVVAKIVSTCGFLYLALIDAPAWLVCAAGDGFVAVSLIVTHPGFSLSSQIHGFLRTFSGQQPYYEVWYGKIDLAPEQALWFRYTLLSGKTKEACVWGILFDRDQVYTGKQIWRLEDLSPPNSVLMTNTNDIEKQRDVKQVFHVASARLDEKSASGCVDHLSWNLEFKSLQKSFSLVPQILYQLKLAKSNYQSCLPDLRFDGVVEYKGQKIQVKNAKGMLGHIYGSRQAFDWAWCHCNSFQNEENVVFEALSARVKVAGKVLPAMSSLILVVHDKIYSFSSLVKLFQSESKYGKGQWEFQTEQNGVVLKGRVEVKNPKQVALVEYTDTDDSRLWCHNSKLAHLTLHLTDVKNNIDKTFEAHGTAAFEIVNRIRPERAVDL